MGEEEMSGFLSRWARRKEQVRSGVAVAPEPVVEAPVVVAPVAPVVAKVEAPLVEEQPAAEPLPTMADVALLTRESDYSRFVSPGIDEGVKRAAMKKLFTDPHFNVMDGLDIYIDDYGIPDPLPEGMLRKMVQAKMLRLFDDEPEEAPAAAVASTDTASTTPHTAPDTATPELSPTDEDLAVQLQPDDDAGRPGSGQGAGEDAGRQH